MGNHKLSKAEARERGLAIREGLSAEDRADRDHRIVERCREELPWERYGSVHLYLPIKRRHEINIWLLLPWIWQTYPKIQVYVPRLAMGAMEQVAIGPETKYKVNPFGIPEPTAGVVVGADTRFDLVLVPLLAFDEAGHRVGYGGGYYDRFLATQPAAHRVGLAYEDCLVEEGLRDEAHDVRLHMILTERTSRKIAPQSKDTHRRSRWGFAGGCEPTG
jgi:5-formyltetrahydrofolate cyclo-ligase